MFDPRWGVRHSGRIALCLLSVAAGACSKPAPGAEKIGVAASAAPPASAAPVENPVKIGEIAFDFYPGPEVAPKATQGLLSFGLTDFKARWSSAAARYGSPAIELRPNGILDRGYRDALALLAGASLRVHGLLLGNSGLHSLTVLASPYQKGSQDKLFAAWETLLDSVDPSASASDHRAIYQGLGLFTGKIAGAKVFEHKGLRYTVAQRATGQSRSELWFTVEPLLPTAASSGVTSVAVPEGSLANGDRLELFFALAPAETRPKTFSDAVAACQAEGLDLCSDAQWTRACTLAPAIAAIETWTASFTPDYAKLQVRGGGTGCEAATGALSSELKASRGMCCTRAIALAGDLSRVRQAAHAVMTFERATNLRSESLFEQSLAPELSQYYLTENVPRERAIALSLPYLQKTGAYSMHERCAFQALDPGGVVTVQCAHATFTGSKAMATQSKYGYGPSGLVSVRDPLILRKNSAF
ncbi:MAG: hypothetical protein WDO74_07225 [Pseudomonadota bacterium]